MSKQSKELTKFYKEYALWLDEGAPNQLPFWRQNGLCASLADMDWPNEIYMRVKDEMNQQFVNAHLYMVYPFNGSSASFYKEACSKTLHLNKKRIDWVLNHMKG